MSPRGHPSKRIQALVDDLRAKFGVLSTKEEVARANRFNAELDPQTQEEEAWERYKTKHHGDRGRAWGDIMLYRTTSECSIFFVPVEDNGGALETGAVDELDVCGVAFLRLLSDGRLSELEGIGGFQTPTNVSIAQGLKLFMEPFRDSKGSNRWGYKEIIDSR
jgi:hypothetical protein